MKIFQSIEFLSILTILFFKNKVQDYLVPFLIKKNNNNKEEQFLKFPLFFISLLNFGYHQNLKF